MRETVLNRELARAEGRRREIKASETNENGYGKRGSVFGRIWETSNQAEAGMMEEDSVVTGECEEAIITQFLPVCGEGNDQVRIYSAETHKMRIEKRALSGGRNRTPLFLYMRPSTIRSKLFLPRTIRFHFGVSELRLFVSPRTTRFSGCKFWCL